MEYLCLGIVKVEWGGACMAKLSKDLGLT